MDDQELKTAAETSVSGAEEQPTRRTHGKLIVIVLATVAVTLGAVWLVRTYIYPALFQPVELSMRAIASHTRYALAGCSCRPPNSRGTNVPKKP